LVDAGLFFFRTEKTMGNWEPIFWIFAVGIGWFALLLVLQLLKGNAKKKPPEKTRSLDA